eukprot:scaffold80_cov325-Pavlova_lutheri.AAC.26
MIGNDDVWDQAFSELFGYRMNPLRVQARPNKQRKLNEQRKRLTTKKLPHGLLLQAELPGVTASDVKISVEEECLKLQGPQNMEHSYPLPEGVDRHSVKACLLHGVLKVLVPKVPPRQVKITSEQIDSGKNSYLIKVNVPGFGPDDVSVEVDCYSARLRGQKEERKIEREFTLPKEADPETLQVSVRDGVLKMVLHEKTVEPIHLTVHANLPDTLEDEAKIAGMLQLSLDIPGCKPEDVHVQVEGTQMSLAAERRLYKGDGEKKTKYRHEYKLPYELRNPDDLHASVVDGVFRAQILPSALAQPQKLEVEVTEDSSMWKEL